MFSTTNRYSLRVASGVLVVLATVYFFLDGLTETTTLPSISSWGRDKYRSVTCPSIHDPIFPVNRQIHAKQECRPVVINDTAWAVEICSAPRSCNQFTVRVSRTDQDLCRAVESGDLPTIDDDIREWMKVRGPDSFLLRTSGAQRWATSQHRYEGSCSYAFDVSLSNGGPVWLELWFGYENYAYLAETSPAWPVEHHQPLFAPMRLNLCPLCPLEYPSRLVESEPVWPPESTRLLPSCPRDQPVDGLWLMRNPMDVVDPPYLPLTPRQGDKPLMGHYDFKPKCQFTHAGQAFSNHAACLDKPQKVLWVGDSHSRYALLNFIHRLGGSISPYPEDDKGVGVYGALDPSRTFVYDQLTLDFQMDAYAEHLLQLSVDRLASYDAIIFSNGAWAAMAGKPTAFYKERIEAAFAHVSQVNKSQRRVYLVPAPFPPQTSGHVVERKEHRTNVLLGKWRDEAYKLADKYGWRVVDQYERGMGVVLEMLAADALHLSPGAAIDSILDEIIDKAEMCAT